MYHNWRPGIEILRPPSTARVWPVTKEASSEAKNATNVLTLLIVNLLSIFTFVWKKTKCVLFTQDAILCWCQHFTCNKTEMTCFVFISCKLQERNVSSKQVLSRQIVFTYIICTHTFECYWALCLTGSAILIVYFFKNIMKAWGHAYGLRHLLNCSSSTQRVKLLKTVKWNKNYY